MGVFLLTEVAAAETVSVEEEICESEVMFGLIFHFIDFDAAEEAGAGTA